MDGFVSWHKHICSLFDPLSSTKCKMDINCNDPEEIRSMLLSDYKVSFGQNALFALLSNDSLDTKASLAKTMEGTGI